MEGVPQFWRTVYALVKRVPFYPLSALGMLLGCYTLNNVARP